MWLGPARTKTQRAKSVTNGGYTAPPLWLWEVSTAGVPQWPGASQTRCTHTAGPRCSSNRRFQGSGRRRVWTLFSTSTVSTTHLDVVIGGHLSSNPALVAAASTRPGHMAKRAEKSKFERYPRIDLVPFILETTGHPRHHAKKFISNLMKDADNPPLAIRDTWSAIQSGTPQRHLQTTTHCRRYVTLRPPFATPCLAVHSDPRYVKCQCRPCGNTCRGFSFTRACCDDTSSDDDEHNTNNTLLLLFADAYIAPALLAGLSEVDELMIALGCRFALDIFTIAQQDRPPLDPVPLPLDPGIAPWF